MADPDTTKAATPLAPAAAPAPAAALPTLPHSLLHEICHYLWPADVARLAVTCRGLGLDDDDDAAAAGAGGGCSPLIVHGLRWFRPSRELDAMTTFQLICRRLPRLKGLRVMDLSGAEIPAHAIGELGRLAADEGAFRSVRVLSFYGNRLGRQGSDALGWALEQGGFRDTLEGLYVMNNYIAEELNVKKVQAGHYEVEHLILTALRDGACQAPLRALSLARNRLDHTAAVLLASALRTPHLKQLKKLDLHDNRFDNLSVEAIAAALQDGGGMPCLDELYLGFNTFADECLPDLAAALRTMPALRELDLSSCYVGHEYHVLDRGLGVAAFASSLVRAADDPDALVLAVETIDLRGNKISAAAAEALLGALTDGAAHERARPLLCPRLTALYLDDNLAVRQPRGREALQKLQAATGIKWAYAEVW